jgi:alginate O-acetyltransferase complex protein AlgI
MLFTSAAFFAFLAIVLVVYYLPGLRRWQIAWLAAASLFFYGYSQPYLLVLLLAVALIDIACSYQTVRSANPRLWAAGGVAANLLILALFKYNHLMASLAPALAGMGEPVRTLLMLPLPIGISFFTFHGISLLVDTFKRQEAGAVVRSAQYPAAHARNTLFYLSFFPQLIAGPIMKARDFFPQMAPKAFRDIPWTCAVEALILGYFLKVVIADNLNQQTFWLAYPYFMSFSTANLVLVLLGYSAQIFADFAGYSLIAIGLARLFGYRLPTNFLFPYISQSFAEFWTRWHMSLSAWLREYLYFPLGGNRRGRGRTLVNLMVVMILGGLWHGAAISYAVWGFWHGAALVVERLCDGLWLYRSPHPVAVAMRVMLVFGVVTLGWLLFKLPNFSDVLSFLQMLGQNAALPLAKTNAAMIVIYAAPVVLYHLHYVLQRRGMGLSATARSAAFGLLAAAIVINPGPPQDFIYFQF